LYQQQQTQWAQQFDQHITAQGSSTMTKTQKDTKPDDEFNGWPFKGRESK